MFALIFDKALKLDDVSIPERKKGESLIKVRLTGICNTDIEIVKAYPDPRKAIGAGGTYS